ncbi:MAG: ribokinase [Treponema sp.]|nr:ribokinase [Treponema sp.]
MKFLNFGSLNLDIVYKVPHIVAPGETVSSYDITVAPGGKGLNQSVALSRAGGNVYHAGMIGEDGGLLIDVCNENNINSKYIIVKKEKTGNALIQVSDAGENSIVLFGGANKTNTKNFVDSVLSDFGENDVILLQNEINLVDYIIERAYEKKMKIVLNPSPFNKELSACDFNKVSLFFINEVEGEQITGKKSPDEILKEMNVLYPESAKVLTLGKQGCIFSKGDKVFKCGIYPIPVVDTTAAGDTFTGYFCYLYFEKKLPVQEVLDTATKASALAVSRKSAVPSIPVMKEVLLLK